LCALFAVQVGLMSSLSKPQRRLGVLVEGCGSLTPRPLYLWGKPQVLVFSRLGWPPNRSGSFLGSKIFYPCQESNPGSFSRWLIAVIIHNIVQCKET